MIRVITSLLFLIGICGVSQASLINLDFSNQQQANNATSAFSLGPAYTGNMMTFLNVATSDGITVDARVTATAFGVYDFAYHIPNYNQTSAVEPNGDIGFLMYSNAYGTGGLTYLFELFDGTGGSSGSFTTPYMADELAIMAYDVDGEPQQSESFRAYLSDGLFSYQTGTHAASLVATTESNGEILFTGPSVNYSEQSTVGAAILNYRNTSNFTLNFESETHYGSLVNPVFSAIDGGVSMGLDNFGPTVSVNEPPAALLLMLASFTLLVLNYKKGI